MGHGRLSTGRGEFCTKSSVNCAISSMSDISISDARENLSGAVSDSRKDQLRISGVIDLLAQNPLPPKALKLSGRDGYRIRVGN